MPSAPVLQLHTNSWLVSIAATEPVLYAAKASLAERWETIGDTMVCSAFSGAKRVLCASVDRFWRLVPEEIIPVCGGGDAEEEVVIVVDGDASY